MSNPWTFSGESATRLQGGSVVLVEGTSFSISSSSGNMEPGELDGLFQDSGSSRPGGSTLTTSRPSSSRWFPGIPLLRRSLPDGSRTRGTGPKPGAGRQHPLVAANPLRGQWHARGSLGAQSRPGEHRLHPHLPTQNMPVPLPSRWHHVDDTRSSTPPGSPPAANECPFAARTYCDTPRGGAAIAGSGR